MSGLEKWIEQHNIDCDIRANGSLLKSNGKTFVVLTPESGGFIFDEDLNLNITKKDKLYSSKTKADYYLYEFGGSYYYTPVEGGSLFNKFIYFGKSADESLFPEYAPLGVHGNYELLSGNRNYSDWVSKADFLGYEALGICELNTLAGTISFQKACDEKGIKPVLGETVNLKDKTNTHQVKFYALTKKGWRNLLYINKLVNIGNNDVGRIDSDDIKSSDGVVAVITPDINVSKTFINKMERLFGDDLYVQVDPVEYYSDEQDKEHLLSIKKYRDDYGHIKPVLINDMYYLEDYESHIRKKLAIISGKSSVASYDQHFKSLDDIISQFENLFGDEDSLYDFLDESIGNVIDIVDRCDFKIELGTIRMPKFIVPSDYIDEFDGDNDGLFFHLIEAGVKRVSSKSDYTEDELMDRVDHEVSVIIKGGFIDYFLILWDICDWCRKNDILVGVGRGSAGGSLVAYLLGITMINPLDYDLLFERFLNESRMEKELPDIDVDFEGLRREEVKRYMEDRYGADSVCSIGTYGTFQIKAALKDLSKNKGVDFSTVNFITSRLDLEDSGSWEELFKIASEKPSVKGFIRENSDVINDIRLILNQPKSQSIHACATLITPTEDDGEKVNIFDWIPLRETSDGVLVSEWEGDDISSAGFLKEDILGVKQLDKFRAIINHVKETIGDDIIIEDIPLDEPKVYEMFQEGKNEDVFHFGTRGLKAYSLEVKPDKIEDLIAMNSLYRPGTMLTNAHKDYVSIKNGNKEPEYDYMLEEVTKDTYGLYIFQEQIMRAVQTLGGFNLTEADQVRKAMGKKKMALIEEYKSKFIDGAEENGCPTVLAERIWDKLEVFGRYGFNKSHAAAYSIMGYISQYLKWKYPLQFWAVAFSLGDEDKYDRYVSEIHNTDNGIAILPPDINSSYKDFTIDHDKNEIYWSLGSIKYVGDVALENILNERDENGVFFSIEEFMSRVEKSKVNKRVVLNLILSGSFDKMYNIKSPHRRLKVVKEYYKLLGENLPDEYKGSIVKKNYFWMLKQRESSGLSHFDFRDIVKGSCLSDKSDMWLDVLEFKLESSIDKHVVLAGIIVDVTEKSSKKGKFGIVNLQVNDEEVKYIIWSKHWDKETKNKIMSSKGKIIVLNGKVYHSGYESSNGIQHEPSTKICIL